VAANLYGRHPVLEALRAGRRIERIYLAEATRSSEGVDEIRRLAAERQVPVALVGRRELDQLFPDVNHQGVAAQAAPFAYRTLDDLVAAGQRSAILPLILVLDALEDPQNFGTLIRTADAIGATGVIIPLHRAVGVTSAVEKASAGAVEFVPVARVANLVQALAELKRHGYWVLGLDASGTERYDRFAVDVPLALVVGAEGRGLGRLVQEACDALVEIPMRGHVGSLNAAVAGSIVLYDISRRRGSI
jgi:23S rRNA (guanosine2251-2'-O)-methyltransferase